MKINLKHVLAVSGFACISLLACKDDAKKETAYVEEVPGLEISNMDKEVSPKDDFYNYVNGTWMKTAEIPGDRSRWGSFDELRKKTDEDALAILKSALTRKQRI